MAATEEILTTSEAPHAGIRTDMAIVLMWVSRAIPLVLGILFGLADTALTIWAIVTGHWGLVVVSFLAFPLAMGVGQVVVTLLAMPFYGLARLMDRDTAELILEGWD